MGYAESKWVSESILLNARETTGANTATVRVGQLSGDTRVGGWNKQEWVGAIARAGQIVKSFPERDAEVSMHQTLKTMILNDHQLGNLLGTR